MTALPQTTPSWLVSEHAPLDWLISLIFVDDFWDLLSLTRGHFDFLRSGNIDEAIKPARYNSFDEIWKAASDFVANDAEAKKLRDKAIAAIESGELSYYQYPRNEWGDKLGFGRDDDMDSLAFLRWAGKQGYGVHEEVAAACEHLMRSERYRQEAAEKEARNFPTITQEDFNRVSKEPLWRVGTAILYLLGRRSRREGKEHEYEGDDGLFEKILRYAHDANKTHLLTLAAPDYLLPKVGDEKSKDDHEHQYTLDSKVTPQQIIDWAKTLPVELPMLSKALPVTQPTPVNVTPEMQLMLDAHTRFWSSETVPMKKHVTAWLVEEAKKRDILLSNNLAIAMDTIMRPHIARKGGLKPNKS